MSLATYESLVAAIADWLNMPDLGVMIPDFVRLAEADLQRRVIHAQGMAATASLTTTAGAADLPATFNGVLTAKGQNRLRFIPPDVFFGYADASGTPCEYTLIADQMLLYPSPPDGTVITLVHKVKLALLTTGANWLLTNHPDAYLFGALVHAEPYIGKDIRAPMWSAKYENILRSIELDGIRLSSGGSLQLKSNGF